MNFPDLINDLKKSFPLSMNEEIRLMQLFMCGGEFISAGVTTWCNSDDKVTRYTQQITSESLRMIADKTSFHTRLMQDIDNVESELLAAHDPESLRKCLYVYCLTPDKHLKFSGFSRTSGVPVDKDKNC